jgi:hypothetical protein
MAEAGRSEPKAENQLDPRRANCGERGERAFDRSREMTLLVEVLDDDTDALDPCSTSAAGERFGDFRVNLGAAVACASAKPPAPR